MSNTANRNYPLLNGAAGSSVALDLLSVKQALVAIDNDVHALNNAAPNAVTLTGDVAGSATFDENGDVSIAVTLKGDVVANMGNVSGATAINFANGSYQYGTVVGATTLSVTNVPNDGRAYGLTLEITNGGTNVTWPAGVTWTSGSAPTLKASGVNVITLITRNGGVSWLGTSS